MRKSCFIITFFSIAALADAQSWPGLTGKPDTSYNTGAAYRSSVKNYPHIKIVEELHSAAITEQKNISYCKIGKRELLLDVFYPKEKNKTKRTAIIIIHGGGWRSGNRTQHYSLAQHLANLGYVCFTPEYRLSTEALYPAAVYDIKATVRWVKENAKKYNIDTGKIAVMGFSAGGQLAALVGNTNGNSIFEGTGCSSKGSSDVKAIVDIDGTLSFVHPESGEGDDSKRISAATNWFGISKKDGAEIWKQASPLTWAGKNSIPTLFINSSVTRMHAGRTDYINILRENNIYTEVKEFENSPHHFCLFEPWFEPTVKTTDEFLKKVFNH